MALELEGTLSQKLGVQSGTTARGQWIKQEFILEYPDGNYTAQACLLAWGQEKIQELDKYQVGDRIRVSFNIKSREFNGRWYNDLQIWRIAPAGQAAGPVAAPVIPVAPGPVASAPSAPAFDAPAPTLDDMPADDPGDDLPF